MKIRSLRFKISAAILGTSALIAVLSFAILYPFEMSRHAAYEKKIFLLLDTVFHQKREDLANELFAGQKKALAASLQDMLKVEGIVGITVCLPDGQVFLATEDVFAVPMKGSERRALSESSTLLPRYRTPRFPSLGVYTRQIGVIGMPVGYIRLYYDVSGLERETQSFVMIFVVLLVTILVLMSGLLNFLLTRFVTRPMSLLREAILKLQKGHLGETVHLPSGDEIGDVGRVFNEMSVDLERSQVALQQAEEKYRGIFENATEAIFQRTPGKGHFLTVNPSMVRMLGYASEKELLASVADIGRQLYVRPKDHEEFERVLAEHGRIVGFETELYRKDRSTVWVSASARRVPGTSGGGYYYEGLLVDVTERREKEKAERAKDTAEAASKAKSEFLANMSHEIRTPMNAILGFTSLLSPLITDPRQKNYLQSIQSSGKNLMSLINDILDLSKIEAGKMEIQYEPVVLRSVFVDLEKVFSWIIQDKGLQFITSIASDVPECVLLDEVRLRQILFNLVGNALRFTESGWIRLSAWREEGAGDGSFCLVMVVEDTGMGIQPEAHNRIFESFRQQSGQRARVYGGTGLGLTISKSLVEMLGGTISVQSRPGAGSVFEIRLPDVSEAAETDRAEQSETSDVDSILLDKAKVLVVDDLDLNRKLVKEFLQNTRVEVIEADNGQTALQAAETANPDLILMDIRMPGMDGYQALRRLRRNPATRRIPVVALTASGMKEEIERLERSGFDGWLVRPFSKPELLKELHQFIHDGKARTIPVKRPQASGLASAASVSSLPEHVRDEIVAFLENELMDRWEVVSRKQHISEIEDFGCRIKALGDRYGVSYLSTYADNLLFHTASFDVENIRRALDAYPEFVAGVRK